MRSTTDLYEQDAVVTHYANDLTELFDAERHLFDRHIRPDDHLLDLGAGAGRTTGFLAHRVARYVASDLAPRMVEEIRRRFPGVEADVLDATALSTVASGSFDVVLFSFNGIDHLPGVAARLRFLSEARRILRPGGRLIFSSHNPWFVWRPISIRARPGWRLIAVRVTRSARRALVQLRNLATRADLRRGDGYAWDPVHGGCTLHAARPSFVVSEAAVAGFELVEWTGGSHPERRCALTTAFYYYVFARADVTEASQSTAAGGTRNRASARRAAARRDG